MLFKELTFKYKSSNNNKSLTTVSFVTFKSPLPLKGPPAKLVPASRLDNFLSDVSHCA